MQNCGLKYKKNTLFIYLLIIIFSFLFFILDLRIKKIEASSINFQIEIFYAKETHQIDTTANFTEILLNPNNSSFEINSPANVLTSGEAIKLNMYSTPKESVIINKPLPSGKLGADIFYNISFKKLSNNTPVVFFDKPITLTFYYLDSDISGINENTLAVYRWNGSVWTILGDSVVDTSLNKVAATSQQFSDFALLGNPSTSCGDGNCDSSEACSSCPADCGSCFTSGGGGYIIPTTSVIFSGKAYPNSTVTLLKDSQIAATAIADINANFLLRLSGFSGGNYIFNLYSEDDRGDRSPFLTFPMNVASGATANIVGIFIAPTIAVDKEEVRKGDNIAIFGQSAPNSEITIITGAGEEFFSKVNSDNNGAYLYNFDTANLNIGRNFTKSKAVFDGNASFFSKPAAFMVGAKNIAKGAAELLTGDLNGDRRVNLIDFSIAAYWYKRLLPPANVDLNSDGKVDLVDFSIMAFYWTG